MAGVIWFVQVVHYPIFSQVGPDSFVGFEAMHARLTTCVVAPFMLVELLAAIALAVRPASAAVQRQAYGGLALLGMIWVSTFVFQVPQHDILLEGYDPHAHRLLVATNWIRTVAWTLRGALAVSISASLWQQNARRPFR